MDALGDDGCSSCTESVGGHQGAAAGAVTLSEGAVYAGKYRVLRRLGQGGMGVVFEAQHLHHGGRVALKVLAGASDVSLAARLHQEAAVLARLRSPHVVRLLDSSLDDRGSPYLALELLDGQTAAARLAQGGPLPASDVQRIGVALCEALAEAHALGIVHRDLKPSNIFLARDGDHFQTRLLDFGVARAPREGGELTGHDGLVGSMRYASPEQLRDARSVDARSDLWSLGVTLFELLTGKHPFGEGAPSAVVAAICADPPRDLRALAPRCPRALADAVNRCLQRRPAGRPASASALRAALLGQGGRGRRATALGSVAAGLLVAAASLARSPQAPALATIPPPGGPPVASSWPTSPLAPASETAPAPEPAPAPTPTPRPPARKAAPSPEAARPAAAPSAVHTPPRGEDDDFAAWQRK